MNIKEFRIDKSGDFEYADLTHDSTIRFVLSDDHYIDCRIVTDRREQPVLSVTSSAFFSEMRIVPVVSNAVQIGFTRELKP